MRKVVFILVLVFLGLNDSNSQNLNVSFPIYEEFFRREQLNGNLLSNHSFFVRPLNLSALKKGTSKKFSFQAVSENQNFDFLVLPLVSQTTYNTTRPYGWGNKGMLPNVGLQSYLSTGVFMKIKFFELQVQPEIVYGQNKAFEGFGGDFPTLVLQSRFFYWNNGDNPERFGNSPNIRAWWGQSFAKFNFGSLALGISTENIGWGPGQFNSLIFSANAEGFPHLKLETHKPIKTFLGIFEGQILMGRLENSLESPTQNDFLNNRYFKPFDGDWRYVNGVHIAYQPNFLKGFTVGFSRTFQQYSKLKGNKFRDWFPIFEVFQKETFFQNGNTVDYDNKGQDQQVAVSFRFLSSKGRFEVYSEFGRRDHNFNWREFILNPEHARAFLFGFSKLFPVENDKLVQLRGEITHQQESVNRYIRYPGLIGNQTWHTHGLARGFVNRGESLGVGIGVGSNVQTLELSIVDGLEKKGIQLERLANHQDFFYRAFGQNPEKRPWIDYSLGLIWDQQFDSFILGSKVQIIKSQNYQWESGAFSSEDFDNGPRSLSLFGQVHLIYHFRGK